MFIELNVPCSCRHCLQALDKANTDKLPFFFKRIACPTCGNRYCPHAVDHHNSCTHVHELEPTETARV